MAPKAKRKPKRKSTDKPTDAADESPAKKPAPDDKDDKKVDKKVDTRAKKAGMSNGTADSDVYYFDVKLELAPSSASLGGVTSAPSKASLTYQRDRGLRVQFNDSEGRLIPTVSVPPGDWHRFFRVRVSLPNDSESKTLSRDPSVYIGDVIGAGALHLEVHQVASATRKSTHIWTGTHNLPADVGGSGRVQI